MKKLIITLLMSLIASPNLGQASCAASASLDALKAAATDAYNTASSNNDTAYENYSSAAANYTSNYNSYISYNNIAKGQYASYLSYNQSAANHAAAGYKGWAAYYHQVAINYLNASRTNKRIADDYSTAYSSYASAMSTYQNQMTSYQTEMSQLSSQINTYTASIDAVCASSGASGTVSTSGGSVDDAFDWSFEDDEASLLELEDSNRLQYSGASTAVVAQNSDFDFIDDVNSAVLSWSGSKLVGLKLYDSTGNRISLPSGTSLSNTTSSVTNADLIVIRVKRNNKMISLIIDKETLNVFSTDDTAIAHIESVVQDGRVVSVGGVSKSVLAVKARNAAGSLINIGLLLEGDALLGIDL